MIFIIFFLIIIILLVVYYNNKYKITETFALINSCPWAVPDAVCNSINGIETAIQTKINDAKTAVKREVNNDIISPIQNTINTIEDGISRQATIVENSAISAVRGVTDGISREVTRVENEITSTADSLINSAKSEIRQVTDGISREVNRVEGEITSIAQNLVNEAKGEIRQVTNGLSDEISRIEDTVTSAAGRLVDEAKSEIQDITNSISRELTRVENKITTTANRLIDSAKTEISEVTDGISREVTRVENSISEVATRLINEAKAEITEITNTISREIQRVERSIEITANRLIDEAKSEIKIITDAISREITRVENTFSTEITRVENSIEEGIQDAQNIFDREVVKPVRDKINEYVDIWKRRYEDITSMTTDIKDITHEIQKLMKGGFMVVKDTIMFTITTGEVIYLMFKKAESCSESAKLIGQNIEQHLHTLGRDLTEVKERIKSCTSISRFINIRNLMNFNNDCIKTLLNGNDHLKEYITYLQQVFQNRDTISDLSQLPQPLNTLFPPNDNTYLQMTPDQKSKNYTFNVCSDIRQKGHQQRLQFKNTEQYRACIQRKNEDFSYDLHECIQKISYLKGPELRRFETWEYAKNCNQCLSMDGLLSRGLEEFEEINDMISQITMVIGIVEDLHDTINLLKSNMLFMVYHEMPDSSKPRIDGLIREQILEVNGNNRIPSNKSYIQHKTDIVNRCNNSPGDKYSVNNQKLSSIINSGINGHDLLFDADINTGVHADIKAGNIKPSDWVLQDTDELGNIDFKGKLKNKSTTECGEMRVFLQREHARNLRSKIIQDTGNDPWSGTLKSLYPLNTNILRNQLPNSHPLSQRSISSRQQTNNSNTISPLNLPQENSN